MTLAYLVRHGHALPGPEDRTRPLSDQGREDVRRVARHLAVLGMRVADIRHSGLLRARQTAEVLAAHLAGGRAVSEAAGLPPDADPVEARCLLEAMSETVMLVGHMPHLGRLAAALLTGDPGRQLLRFPPATIVAVARADEDWALEWVLTPALAGQGAGAPTSASG